MNEDFFKAFRDLSKENEITQEELLEKLKNGMIRAIKKQYPGSEHISVDINPDTGSIDMKVLKEVMPVMYVDSPENEIYIEEAKTYDPDIKVGDWVEIPVSLSKLGRVASQQAKQSLKGDMRDIERNKIIEEFKDKEHECVSAIVERVEPQSRNADVKIGSHEIYFRSNDQIPGEVLKAGDIIKVYVVSLGDGEKKQPAIRISRTHRDLVKRLFELEVPEIADGTVEVKAISRIAGKRSKIAVWSKDPNVDAVGACIGPRKMRISSIVNELKGEKIDVITYSEDDVEFIAKALAPAQVLNVELLEDEIDEKGNHQKRCRAVVPNNQFTLAIGSKGDNAKLAAGLTKYKIDIVAEHPEEMADNAKAKPDDNDAVQAENQPQEVKTEETPADENNEN